ncbi:MAG: SLOG family protein [Candidatus Heritagella sp.]
MKRQTCCFTGHRPQNLPFRFNEKDERCMALKRTLREQIIPLIEKENVTHFLSGMAIGIDMYAAEIVLDLKKSYPGITLESVIPCESQAMKWSETLRNRYFRIVAQCDHETRIQMKYTPDCMDKRNRYMVDHSDIVIAVWSGKPSGTGKTVRYALDKGKMVVVINPITCKVDKKFEGRAHRAVAGADAPGYGDGGAAL